MAEDNSIVEFEAPLMIAKVFRNSEDGEYILQVRVPDKSINEWTLGLNEEIAKSKVSTILNAYTQGLEYVQEQVRTAFAVEADSKEQGVDQPTAT